MSNPITISVRGPQDLKKVHRALQFLVEEGAMDVESSSISGATVTHDLGGVLVAVTYTNEFTIEVSEVEISAQEGHAGAQEALKHLINHLANA